jgi:hypothetical protein
MDGTPARRQPTHTDQPDLRGGFAVTFHELLKVNQLKLTKSAP